MAEIKTLLAGVLGAAPNRDDVRAFVAHCHRIAIACLYRQIKTGRLQRRLVAGNVEQFALDCIAELFARDEEGTFPELNAYYGDVQAMDEEALLTVTRRLVFSQVNDAVFRHYKERDPTLSRIIRAAKRCVKETRGLKLIRHHRRLWIVRPDTDPAEVSRIMPEAFLEYQLCGWLARSNRMTDVVRSLAAFFEDLTIYTPAVRLSDFALSIRSAQTHLHVADPTEPIAWNDTEHPLLTQQEITDGIQKASARVQARLFDTYVDRKVDAPTFGMYVRTARDFLASQYTDGELTGSTRLEILARNVGPVSREEYGSTYRNILDYMIRETRDELLDILRHRI